MISFYPGPSRVYDDIPRYVRDGYRDGILSINHRSEEFMKISRKTIRLLKSKLNVPRDYTVFFTSSATECWEIIAQSLITKSSYHFFNGAFGEKWYEYTRRLTGNANPIAFDLNESPSPGMSIPEDGVICMTQNETSNGTQVHAGVIRSFRKTYPGRLIAIDATSSMAGTALDFASADIWFASVQKCFGLPAGLGIMICSPDATQKATTLGEKNHYNSLTFMMSMMEKWQTPFTPNVLNIYLLMRVLENVDNIRVTQKRIIEQYQQWRDFLERRKRIAHFVTNPDVHSYTVVPVKGDEKTLSTIKSKAKKEGFLLGEGYGAFKPLTFRIANFPAIRKAEIKALQKFLAAW